MTAFETLRKSKSTRPFWAKLKELSVWERKKKKMPKTMLKEDGKEVSEKGDWVDVWKEAFRKLGIEDLCDDKFDQAFAREVKRETKERSGWESDRAEDDDELNGNILFTEVRAAVAKLKGGKAAGVDGMVNETLKYGGDKLMLCLWIVIKTVWREESIPKDWTRGLIIPIFKKGDKRNPLNYRGITLLSVVGKVFASILNRRLVDWSEANGKIVEEQGGFRPHRGCPDQIFTLIETLKSRRRQKKTTVCCFIDIKKAYDRVFRAGLWKQLAEKGIKGKLLRVISVMYESVESKVLVAGGTEWFPINVGVRQGCVLSPFLFSIFIDGLAVELNQAGLGIEVGGNTLNQLMYADDIVLMADNDTGMQSMLDIVSEYSRKWRFELSDTKTEVMIFGDTRRGGLSETTYTINRGLTEIKVVKEYKYLGTDVVGNLRWRKFKDKALKKARRNMARSWGMGIQSGCMTTEGGIQIWKTLVRPVLEYAVEVWPSEGDRVWEEAERVQKEMGYRILGRWHLTGEVVRGELGWWTMRARRDMLRLRYWAKILRMQSTRWVSRVYRITREEAQAGASNWCSLTKKILDELGMGDVWESEETGTEEEWNKKVEKAIHEREEAEWKTRMSMMSSLEEYVKVKKKLVLEKYLLSRINRTGRTQMTGLRGGRNNLRVHTGRYERPRLERSWRFCRMCGIEAETETHFMLKCVEYRGLRERMYKDINELSGANIPWSRRAGRRWDDRRIDLLIGKGLNHSRHDEVREVVKRYIREAMYRRRSRLEAG
jgi:hypothetical protein